jgi:O-acetylserine/cysteine efflux transporter
MKPRDIMLAVATAAIWGLAFVAIKIALESFSAPQLTALRFIIAALPVLVLPRPQMSWPMLIAIGMTLFTGQFLLLFFAYTLGMPPGVASVVAHTQAFFTVILAAVLLRDIPTLRQSAGILIALSGLVLIGATVGGDDLTLIGLLLTIAGAISWSFGNILLKRAAGIPMFPLMAWLSLIPPLPALLISAWQDGDAFLWTAVANASWESILWTIYLGAISTTLAYAVWGHLLARYPTAVVVPFSLLAPCVGIAASALAFGEVFGPLRYAGMALILIGLAVVVFPGARASAPTKAPG